MQFRDKVLVKTDKGEIEGYVFSVINPKQMYVILAGFNNKPILVDTNQVKPLLDVANIVPPKRGRGRPRKEKK